MTTSYTLTVIYLHCVERLEVEMSDAQGDRHLLRGSNGQVTKFIEAAHTLISFQESVHVELFLFTRLFLLNNIWPE